LCFHLSGDLAEKRGQIAHLDGDPNNNAEDNLVFMCLDHHSLYDSKTSQHKNYSRSEIKRARVRLYRVISKQLHLRSEGGTLDAPLSSGSVSKGTRPLAPDLPSSRPCVTPAAYRIRESDKRSGLELVNDGAVPAYDVSVPDIRIGSSRLHFWGKELRRLSNTNGTVLLESVIEVSKGSILLGIGLAQEMTRHNIGAAPFSILYKDGDNNHYVSHCLIEREIFEPSGVATRFLRQEVRDPSGEIKPDPGRPCFSLDAFDGEIHSYTGAPSYFSLRNCGRRTARDINFDPVYPRSYHHAIRFDRIASLAKDEVLSVGFQSGTDESRTHKGVVNHLISFFEDNPDKQSKLSYPITIRFLDGVLPMIEQHMLEGEPLQSGGVRLKVYPSATGLLPAADRQTTGPLVWPNTQGEYVASSNERIPPFPTALSGYRSENDRDFWNKSFASRGKLRVFEGGGWQGLPNFPNTMTGCSAGVFMIRWRLSDANARVHSSVRFSREDASATSKTGSFGYMSGNNCQQPMFEFARTVRGHKSTLVDIYYELKFWQAAP
jgi:hypothetical protein